jgi:hypothetical protein
MLSATLSLKEIVMNKKVSGESVVKDIRRRTRKKYSSEEKIPIVIDGASFVLHCFSRRKKFYNKGGAAASLLIHRKSP